MILPVARQRIFQCLAGLGMIAGALYLVKMSGEQGWQSALSFLTSVAAVVWVFFAGEVWWVLLPLSVAFGGTLLMEHKFYPHEIALVLCALALLPVMVVRRRAFPSRPALPWTVYGILALFAVNWGYSLYMMDASSIENVGSLSRAYMCGAWAVIFGVLFYRHGWMSPKFIVWLLYGALAVRAALGAFIYVFEEWFPLPKIGFVLSGAALGLNDYRVIGIPLGLLAFGMAGLSHRFWGRVFHYAVLVLAAIGVVAGGGRVTVGMICLTPVVWAVLRRRFGWLAVVGAAGLALGVFLNRSPEVIYRLPEGPQRALSILVTESSTRWLDWHERNRLSNLWHERLGQLGWNRWTESPVTFLIGNRVEPYDQAYEAYSATWESRAEIAAKLGLYESGLWNVLGLIGFLGGLCYLGIFVFLLRGPFRLVRDEGVTSPVHVLAFVALTVTILWTVFSWIAGGFPSFELMMAFFAKAAYEDYITEAMKGEESLAHPN